MKKLMILVASLAFSLPLQAEEKKTVTLEGTGLCAKCSLSETDSCTNALQVKGKDGKIMTYLFTEIWLTGNISAKERPRTCLSPE